VHQFLASENVRSVAGGDDETGSADVDACAAATAIAASGLEAAADNEAEWLYTCNKLFSFTA